MTDGTYGYEAIRKSYNYAPDKLFINTEGCSCPGVNLGEWLRAERLGHDLIFDLQNYAQGWIDWNLLLDENGGPNHLNNICDASIIALDDFSRLFIQPKYYYFGHFTKFVVPGSVRVHGKAVGDYGFAHMDPVIQPNIELALFECERSVRQMWYINPSTHSLQLVVQSKISDDIDPIKLCVAQGDGNRKYLRLMECGITESYNAKVDFVRVSLNAQGQLVDLNTNLCLTISGSLSVPGALIELASCSSGATEQQQFYVNSSTGEIIARGDSTASSCITAGWPFLNSVAFNTPDAKTVVVVMNEASASSVIALSDRARTGTLTFAIPPRSIQTLLY